MRSEIANREQEETEMDEIEEEELREQPEKPSIKGGKFERESAKDQEPKSKDSDPVIQLMAQCRTNMAKNVLR